MTDRSITAPASAPFVILHFAPLQWGKITGLNDAIPPLIEAQNRSGNVQAALLLTGNTTDVPPEPPFPVFDGHQLRHTPDGLDLPSPFDKPHLAVFHSTYIPAHAPLAKILRQRQIPYLLCPHGGMTKRAQSFKRWKKWLGNRLFFNRLVAGAAALHYLTPGEADASGDWKRPSFIAGNGVPLPSEADLATPGHSARLRLTFLGRLDIKIKGLDLLLEACALLRPQLQQRETQIELYGPDQKGSSRVLSQRINQLGLTDVVFVKPPVHGRAKTAVLQQTTALLLTSRSEGHPIAVLEALSYGIPCLVTPGTNMAEEITAAKAGWVAAPSPNGIAEGLQRVLTATPQELETSGANARQLVRQKYTWEQVASRTLAAYRNYVVREV